MSCKLPPDGWVCTRFEGHAGSCAAEQETEFETIKRMIEELHRGSVPMSTIRVMLRTISQDGHVYGGRPCNTCNTITAFLGEPFGCNEFSAKRTKKP